MSGYTSFAKYYDALTANIDYIARAENISRIIRRHTKSAELILDLACGTGSLSFALSDLGFDVIGSDSSIEMLSTAMHKNYGRAKQVLFLRQEMDMLDLYGTVDAVVCTLDSINHIENADRLFNVFKKTSLFMNPGGVFIFDVNTLYKHRDVLGHNTFVYDLPEVYCCWQNTYHTKTSHVNITLDFFSPDGNGLYSRETESFSEWFYSAETLTDLLIRSGLEPIEMLDGDTFMPPVKISQRILYIAKK